MEEQKKTTENQGDLKPEVPLVDKENVAKEVEPTTPETAPAAPAAAPVAQGKANRLTVVAIVLVLIALTAVWYRLESEDRVQTNLFSGLQENQDAASVVAVVNDEELYQEDLELSIEQLRQAATAQGLNPDEPEITNEIRSQAVEMLVNTTLLEQEAAEAGVVITDEQVEARITEIESEAGGAEALNARMDEFGIDRETFEEDVRTELTITSLLDTVFADSDVTVTEEEVEAVYEQAGGGTEGVPPLEEVRTQIETQIVRSKEQSAVDAYLGELRSAADIEITS